MNRLLFLLLLLLPVFATAQVPTITGNAQVQVFQGNDVWRTSLNTLLAGRVGPDSSWVKLSGSYLNKRITDAIYRTGKTGYMTTDTLGYVNIKDRPNTLYPAISVKSGTLDTIQFQSGYILRHDAKAINANHRNFGIAYRHNRIGNGDPAGLDTIPLMSYEIGYNFGASINSAEMTGPLGHYANFWQMEDYFYNAVRPTRTNDLPSSFTGKFPGFETHLTFIDSAGVQIRPFNIFRTKNGKYSDLGFNSNYYYFNGHSGNQDGIFCFNRNSENIPGIMNVFNDSLRAINLSNIKQNTVAHFGSAGRYDASSTIGKGTAITLGGNGSFDAKVGIIAEYSTTNFASNLDLIFATPDNAGTALLKKMWIKSGNSTLVGINQSNPLQTLDVNGGTLLRGSTRINQAADSAALTIKYYGTGISTPSLKWEFPNGTTAMYAHLYLNNSTISTANSSLVFGQTGAVNSLTFKNTAMGITGAQFVSGAGNNSLFGWSALNALNGGYENCAFGSQSGFSTTTGFQNSFFGIYAGYSNTTGYQNMALGRRTMYSTTTGARNTAIGADALRLNVSGNDNTAIGSQAGDAITGNDNTVIGASAARLVTGSGNVIIGRNAASLETSISNYLFIENSTGSIPLIGGDFSTDKVGINTAPGSIARTLHVTGEARITDLTTDTPTLIVGADSDGDLGAITVGSGLSLSSGTLTATGGAGVTDHGALTGLSDDDHTQYLLLAGRSGGQVATGGTGSGDDLTIRSTTNATKGDVIMQDQGGNVILGGGELPTELRFQEGAAGGSNYTAFKAPTAQSADITYTLPTAAPTSTGQVLASTTGGTLSWVDNTQAPSVIRPAQLTAKTDNWNPSGYSTTREQTIELSGDGSFRCITGLESATRDGVRKTLHNSGATNCVLVAKEHTDSDADNRFGIPADVVLYPGMQATFRYDSVSAVWRLLNTSAADVQFSSRTKLSLFGNGGGNTSDGYTFTTSGGTNSITSANTGAPTREFFLLTSVATAFPTTHSKNLILYLTPNTSYIRVAARVKTPQNLSDATNSYELRLGFEIDTDTIQEHGAYIAYNHSENSGGWTLKTNNGSSGTTTNAGSPISATTWYDLEIVYYPYGEVVAWVDGTRYSTTSTLPSSGAMYSFIQIDRDQGTSARTFIYRKLETETARVAE